MHQSLIKDKIFLGMVVLATFLITSLFMWDYSTRGTCKHYASQAEAQKDILIYPKLDGNKDGLACNMYFN